MRDKAVSKLERQEDRFCRTRQRARLGMPSPEMPSASFCRVLVSMGLGCAMDKDVCCMGGSDSNGWYSQRKVVLKIGIL